MADTIMLFEDDRVDQLLPLVYFRPAYDLRCGIVTLREKLTRAYQGASIALHCRTALTDLVRAHNTGAQVNELRATTSCLFLNGRVLADNHLAEAIPLKGKDTAYTCKGTVVAARVSGARLDQLRGRLTSLLTAGDFADLPRQEVSVTTINYPWDLVNNNGSQIVADFASVQRDHGSPGKVYEGVVLLNSGNIVIGEGARVKPGVILDAEEGPIYIAKNATIYPNATIEGPAFIGEGSRIKIGAKIYENTSIGEMCKVGGEVEESIIHSYANKQHDGFLGHAYLGMWVNLGADTNNSDLKNNYGNVRVVINGKEIDTGSMFVGLTMGDHSKSGINTMFNTGTVVGVVCNVFGGGYPPKSIPSFSWGGSDSLVTYDVDRAIEVAKRVMERRKRTMSSSEENLFRTIFNDTASQRS